MKILVFLLFVISPIELPAYYCPSTLNNNKNAQIVFEWLNRFSHERTLQDCQIEITVCEPHQEVNESAPIGEILVKTSDGRMAYLSFDFPHKEDQRYKATIKSSTRALYYKKEDRYFEHINGRTEVWQFEIRTNWDDKTKLEHLDLGLYTTHSQLNQANGNDSHWYNCWPKL